MGLRWVKKNHVIMNQQVVDGLYKNLTSRKEEIERLRDIISINSEREKEHKNKIDKIMGQVTELSEKSKKIAKENLDLTETILELKKENTALKKSVSYSKGYATRYKNKLTLLEGRKK